MKLHFIFGGGKSVEEFVPLVGAYLERTRRYFPTEITVIQSKEKTPEAIRKEESEKMIPLAKKAGVAILFDECGKSLTSQKFSSILTEEIGAGKKEIVIIVGGAYGVSDEVRRMAHITLSFSPMIFPHQMARVMALEQVYRALDIRSGGKYHHA